jgi:hypothetical protein
LGSIYSKKIQSTAHFQVLARILLGMILIMAFLLPVVIQEAMSASVAVKIFISVLSVGCIGFLMGIPFPLGVTRVSLRPQTPLIFYWAVNGFTSMCASAFATVVLINLGYSWGIMIGFAFYVLAFGALQKLARS